MFGFDEQYWKDHNGYWTAREILQQPKTWQITLNQIEENKERLEAFLNPLLERPDLDIVFTGAGTSEYVGNALFPYINEMTGFRARSVASTDLVPSAEMYLNPRHTTLLVSFGRSGNSPESLGAVWAADHVCGDNVYHLFITCNKNGALAKEAQSRKQVFEINLTDETHDVSFAMTSSFTNMMLAAMLCFSLQDFAKVKAEVENVIAAGQAYLDGGYVSCKDLVDAYDFNRIVYLGTNCLKGIAQESALKICELTAGIVTTTYDSVLGFRHGPKSVINDETLSVIYLSNDPYVLQYEKDLIREMAGQKKGNKLIAVSCCSHEDIAPLVDVYVNFNIPQCSHNMFLAFDYILCAQAIALFKSVSLDITPDNPCPTGEVNRVVQGVVIYPFEN